VSMQFRRISVMGPTKGWTHDISVFLSVLYPFLPRILHAPLLSQRERDAQGDLPPQLMHTSLMWGDLAEAFPKAWRVFSQRIGRKQQRYAKFHSFRVEAGASSGAEPDRLEAGGDREGRD
jgi:hypothetical protein